MSASQIANRYFAAWNERDAEAIGRLFADDGRYVDAVVPGGVDRAGVSSYADALFAGFPDLAFTVEDIASDGDERVWARWVMTGTNDGPFHGLPPTGREINVPGVDLILAPSGQIAEVRGFFDSALVPRQLGMQVVVQPTQVGAFAFGTATHAARGRGAPGAMTLTVLEVGTPDEHAEVRERSRSIVKDLMETPGFVSWIGVEVGERMYTITAWESVDDVARLKENAQHVAAAARFFGPSFAIGGQTGVWTPHRLNGLWVRCDRCGQMAPASADSCDSGHALPEPPAYW